MRINENTITSFEQDKVLTIPKNIDNILWDCLVENENNAENIVVEEGNKKYITNGTVLIDKENKAVDLGVKNAIIPSDGSVERVETDAFIDIAELKSIDIPNTINFIGYRAFAGTNIESLVIPESVKVIDSLAFWRCKSLRSVYISANVERIGCGAFAGCNSLRTIEVDKNNKNYISINNCIIERKSKKVVAVINNAIIPDGAESIEMLTLFMNFSCASITIPKSVEKIYENDTFKNFTLCGVFSKGENSKLEKPIKIIAEKGSYAEKYATKNKIQFEKINISIPYPLNLLNAVFGEPSYGDTVLFNKDLLMALETIKTRLNDEEKKVFELFFVENIKMKEVAKILGISSEKVRDILSKLLRRIRHPSCSKIITPFYTNNGFYNM